MTFLQNRSHRKCLRRATHSDAERTCRAVGPTQFTPPQQTRQDGPVCVVSGVPVWIGRLLLWTCPEFKFSVGDSLELSGSQFTAPKRTRHGQDSFVVSGVAVWISCKRMCQIQGCSRKKEVGGRLKQDLDKDVLNNLGLHTCCTEIIVHCVSASNQLQQWTNVCTNFSPKKWGEWGTRPPVEKSGGGTPSPPASPPHYTPAQISRARVLSFGRSSSPVERDSPVALFSAETSRVQYSPQLNLITRAYCYYTVSRKNISDVLPSFKSILSAKHYCQKY